VTGVAKRALVGLVLLLGSVAGGDRVLLAAAAQLPGTTASEPLVTTLTLFAGTHEGLFRSTDWSHTWKRVVPRPSGVLDGLGAARSLVLLTTQVWAGGDGLYVSADFGESWQARARTRGVNVLLPSRWPASDPTMFVGTGFGLLRSRDGGFSFEATALSDAAVHRAEWPGPALVVACDRGVLVSLDQGSSFTGPGRGLPEGPTRAIVLSSFFAADPVLFAAPASGGVFRSSDGGASYAPSGLAGETIGDLVWLGPFLYAAGDSGFYRSQDTGASWTRLSTSPGRPRRLLFPLAPAAGLEAFLATDKGLFRTPDAGEHWAPAGFDGQEVLVVATFPPPEPLRDRRRR
jgi:photosystem II stability/assembly factor-like uncharacterized protein